MSGETGWTFYWDAVFLWNIYANFTVDIIANLFWDLSGDWGTGLSWYIDTLGLWDGLTGGWGTSKN